MKKYLVTIRFNYNDVPKNEILGSHNTKTITIGVYDTQDEAIIYGNKALEVFESHFPLNPHWNVKERFSKNGGCFGGLNDLITNTAWITTPFSVYAKITILDYQGIEETINNVLAAEKRYQNINN